MAHQKFDLTKIARLDDVGRFETMKPDVMWEALGSPHPTRILEIGAGTGLFAEKFAQFAPQATVFAADTEIAMLDWMREHRPGVETGCLVPVLSDERTVPLGSATIDLVMMLNLHHELADPAAVYAESLRLLVPGGQVLVVDWAATETPKGPPLSIRATAEELVSSLERAGFSDVVNHEHALPWHSLVTAVRP